MKNEYDFSRGKRGPVITVPRGKTRITIRIDKDLIDWFRSQVEAAGGGNYQTLINSALREYVREASSEIAEDVARYGRDLASVARRLEREVGLPGADAKRIARKLNKLAGSVSWATPVAEKGGKHRKTRASAGFVRRTSSKALPAKKR
jgi:hypothetical protein